MRTVPAVSPTSEQSEDEIPPDGPLYCELDDLRVTIAGFALPLHDVEEEGGRSASGHDGH